MNAYGSDHNLCFLGYKVVMCSGAEWLRDSTENCSDVKKVVFFKGHGLRTSTKDFFPIHISKCICQLGCLAK